MLTNKHRFALLVARRHGDRLPLAAQAQRKSPLADAPAIRKRFELRSTRLELGVGGGSTVNQDFYPHRARQRRGSASTSRTGCRSPASATSPSRNVETGFQGRLTDSLDPMRRRHRPARADARPRRGGHAEDLQRPGRASSSSRRSPASTRCSASCSRPTTSTASSVRRAINVKTAGRPRAHLRSGARRDQLGDPDRVLLRGERHEDRADVRRRLPHLLQPVAWRSTSSCATSSRSSTRRAATSNGDGLANNDDLTWTHTCMVGAQPRLLPAVHRQDLSLATSQHAESAVPSPKKKVTLYFSSGMLDGDAARGDPSGPIDLLDHPGGVADRARRGPPPARLRRRTARARSRPDRRLGQQETDRLAVVAARASGSRCWIVVVHRRRRSAARRRSRRRPRWR